jgi:peptidoglycan hydrolase CwlO-like protein
MEDYEISNSLDWNRVRTKLSHSKHNLSMFKADVDRMLHAIDDEVKVLGNLEVRARNQKSKSSIETAQKQLDIVNQRIKNFNKYYMIALLAHS